MIRKRAWRGEKGKILAHLLSHWKNIPDISWSQRIWTMIDFKMNVEKWEKTQDLPSRNYTKGEHPQNPINWKGRNCKAKTEEVNGDGKRKMMYFTKGKSKEEKKEEIAYPDVKGSSFGSVGNFDGDVDGIEVYTPIRKKSYIYIYISSIKKSRTWDIFIIITCRFILLLHQYIYIILLFF